ncbi:MAG: tetratricopeptide repeat protein [Firmicutes bacterium]|nr:tetratricopeptide repeat protein [Bacillota bacterium]
MNCIYCGTPLSNIDYCTGCGADITIQKRIIRISNLLYNEGLDKARVRDLSGAIKSLKRSLEFNKENMDARNLLGLVYFESGEVVSALTEWVISKNMNPENNAAEYYIDKLQSNKNKLDTINQTIRKYNQALVYCREDNDDMAMIQLKKVLSQNPKLIKAYHLLALLYLKHQEYEKARKLLKKAAFIDTNNTTTLRYLQEVELATGISTSLEQKRKKKYAKEKVDRLNGTVTYMSGNEMIIQPTTFRDSSTVATFINIFLGILLGAAVVWFLVVPSTRQSIYADANSQVTDANTKMAAQVSKVQGLEEEIADYQSKVDEANKVKDEANKKAESYEDILEAANYYIANDMTKAADALNQISEDSMTGKGKELYTSLKTALSDYVFNEAYAAGATAYAAGDYQKAIEQLKKATEAKPDDFNAWYYLAFSYRNTNDMEKANKAFKEIIQKFPTQAAAYNVSSYMTDDTLSGGSTASAGGTAQTQPADGTQDTNGADMGYTDPQNDVTTIGGNENSGNVVNNMLGIE